MRGSAAAGKMASVADVDGAADGAAVVVVVADEADGADAAMDDSGRLRGQAGPDTVVHFVAVAVDADANYYYSGALRGDEMAHAATFDALAGVDVDVDGGDTSLTSDRVLRTSLNAGCRVRFWERLSTRRTEGVGTHTKMVAAQSKKATRYRTCTGAVDRCGGKLVIARMSAKVGSR